MAGAWFLGTSRCLPAIPADRSGLQPMPRSTRVDKIVARASLGMGAARRLNVTQILHDSQITASQTLPGLGVAGRVRSYEGGESTMGRLNTWAARACWVLAGLGLCASAAAEEVAFDPDFGFPPAPINPGDTIYIIVRLYDNIIPITGYSLNVDIVTVESAFTGTVESNVSQSTFFEAENIITQGGGELHPFSEIFDPGDGGLFVNAFTKDFMPVDLAGEGHDAFARLAWDVSLDAEGEFTIEIGPGSVLVDAVGNEIPFIWNPLTFEVVFPEPSSLTGLGLAAFAWLNRRPRIDRVDGANHTTALR